MTEADGSGEKPSGRVLRDGVSGLARRGALSLGGAAVSGIANLCLVVLVTRAFSKTTAGNLFSVTSVFVMLQALCALGTATGTVYFIAQLMATGRGGEVRQILRLALIPVVVTASAVALACSIFAPQLGEVVGEGDQAVIFVRLVALFLPAAVLADVLIACTQGFHSMTPTVLLEKMGRPTAQLALVGAGAVFGAVSILPVLWMAPYLLVVVLAGLSLRSRVRGLPATRVAGAHRGEEVIARTFWSFTAPRGMAAAAQLALQRLDIVLVAAILGAAPAAVYTAATRFLVLGQIGSQAVALAVQPTFSALLAQGDIESTRTVYRVSTAWVMAVTWPIHLTVTIFASHLMQLFGPGYASGRHSVMILGLSMLVATGCGTVTMLLLMAGRSVLNLMNVVVALVSNVVLNVLLIPAVGITGAAIAWAVSIVLANLLPLAQVHYLMRLNPFSAPVAGVAVLALACFAAVPAVGGLAGPVVTLVLLGGVSVPVYLVGLFRLRGWLALDQLVGSLRARMVDRARLD